MKNEFCAGGLVFNSQGLVLLAKSTKGNWQFPKGHIEEGQTTEEAAF